MLYAAVLGIGLSVYLELRWWMSGLLTGTLILSSDLAWMVIVEFDLFSPRISTILKSVIPVVIYLVGLIWLVLQPSSIVNTVIAIGIILVPTAWILWELEASRERSPNSA